MHPRVVLKRELRFPVAFSSFVRESELLFSCLFIVVSDPNDGSDGVVSHG